ncbi:MAG: universal stress protein [Candidatus Eremiobacterota bacterium]
MKILLPLDGSALSETALPVARALAERWKAEVLLARVVDPFVAAAPGVLPSLAVRMNSVEQEAAARYLDGIRFPGSVTRHATGSPREALVRLAAEEGADLVVMASHGRSGLKRWLLGSVAEAVLRESPCPVLLVRPSRRSEDGFRHILVPVDGSEPSLAVLQRLAPYLAAGGRVTLLRASDLVIHDSAQLLAPAVREAYLRSLELDLQQQKLEGVEVDPRVLDGEAADAILTLAEEVGCDLIAMSSHGRTGLKRLVLGSVAEKVARHAPCPVLVFPPATRHTQQSSQKINPPQEVYP